MLSIPWQPVSEIALDQPLSINCDPSCPSVTTTIREEAAASGAAWLIAAATDARSEPIDSGTNILGLNEPPLGITVDTVDVFIPFGNKLYERKCASTRLGKQVCCHYELIAHAGCVAGALPTRTPRRFGVELGALSISLI